MKNSQKIIFVSAIALFVIGFTIFLSLFAKLFYRKKLLGEKMNVFNTQYSEICGKAPCKFY